MCVTCLMGDALKMCLGNSIMCLERGEFAWCVYNAPDAWTICLINGVEEVVSDCETKLKYLFELFNATKHFSLNSFIARVTERRMR